MGVGVNLSFVCSFEGLGVGTSLFFNNDSLGVHCPIFLFMGGEYKSILFVFGGLRGGYKSSFFFFFI